MNARHLAVLITCMALGGLSSCTARYQDLLRDRDAQIREYNARIAQLLAEQDDLVRKAFTEEDEPMMQACQALMGTTDLMSLKPAILQTDAPGVQARRLLNKEMA